MSEQRAVFDQVNVVVRDIDAAVAFYRHLGFAIDDPSEWPPGSGAHHVGAETPAGIRFELDDGPMANLWYPGRSGGSGAVLGISLPSREAVDQAYADVTDAGYAGRLAPYDAFWGARYAVVADPDGNDVGLMSPIDPEQKYVPEVRKPNR